MEMKFIKTLVESIIKNIDMPKVQVEREISPILEIFIENLMSNLAKNKLFIEEGSYKLIASEFPLDNGKKEKGKKNQRSTNIDFLLLNQNTKILYFVELKTDSKSFKLEQYMNYKEIIKKDATILYKFLANLKNEKYKNYRINIDEVLKENDIENFENIKDIKLVYIAPKNLSKKNKKRSEEGQKVIRDINFVTFEDLKNCDIDNGYNHIWDVIKTILIKLDKN